MLVFQRSRDEFANHLGTPLGLIYKDVIRAENRIDFPGPRVEKFLAKHLGERYEPMDGERIALSTAIVRVVGSRR
jgi:hypothetical protein